MPTSHTCLLLTPPTSHTHISTHTLLLLVHPVAGLHDTIIRLIFVGKIFLFAENVRNYFTRNFCYNEYFSDEYLEQSRCTYAVHAVFVALRILEGYGWTLSIRRYLKPIDGLPNPKGSLSTTIPFAAIASANREDRHLAEFGGHTPRHCTAYRCGNLPHSKPSPSLPCWRHDHSMRVLFMARV